LKRSRIVALAGAVLIVLVVAAGTGSAAPGAAKVGAIRQAKRVCASTVLRTANCGAAVVANAAGAPLAGSSPPATALGPAQFHAAYKLPWTAPTSSTIAIVDAYDDPSIEADLAAYDAQYNLPACTTANGCFRKVNQIGGTGSYPTKDSNWSLEIALDVETAHAMCQNCKILLVEATTASTNNLGAAENEAVSLGANVISNSWGAREYLGEATDERNYFDHPGVAIAAATGDNGYGVEFPAASRYVTAVGGTTLSLASDGSYLGETAWGGTGSGCSLYIQKPAWQTDTGCARRTVADVSADADPNTGAAVYDSVPYSGQTGWFQVGGTSLATPLIAATYVLAGNTGAVQDASGLYGHAAQLHDVTSGTNGVCPTAYLCTAGPGFDGPTGLGTPNGTGAFGSGSSGPPPAQDFSLAAGPASQTVLPGGSTTYSISIARVGGFSSTIALSATGLPSGASASFAPASVDSSTSSSTLTVSTSGSVPVGSYQFTVKGAGGTLVHTATATLVVQASVPADFAVAVSPASRTVTVGGATATYTVSLTGSGGFSGIAGLATSGLPGGASASFSPASLSAGGSSTLTVTTNALLATGTYGFTITGTSGSLTHSVAATLVVQPPAAGDFSLSISPASATVPSTGTTTFTVTVTPSGGFTGQVTLSVSTSPPRGMSFSFSPNPATASSTLTVITAGVTHTRAPVRITISGTSGGLTHTVTLSLST
jgi:hypothetical protein